MSVKHFCDRKSCGKEIVEVGKHRRVEIRGRLYDCCPGECFDLFWKMKMEAERMALQSKQELIEAIERLEREFLDGDKSGEREVDHGGGATIELT